MHTPNTWNVYYVRSDGQERPCLSATSADGVIRELSRHAADYARGVNSEIRAAEPTDERALLLEGRQWAQTLRGLYLHRGNSSMAEHVSTYLKKLESLFPTDPSAPDISPER